MSLQGSPTNAEWPCICGPLRWRGAEKQAVQVQRGAPPAQGKHGLCAGRKLFALVSGVALCVYVFGAGILHGALSLAVNWTILHFAPAHAGALSWLFNFPHLVVWCASMLPAAAAAPLQVPVVSQGP